MSIPARHGERRSRVTPLPATRHAPMPAANRRAMLALLILSGVIISICMGLRQSLGLFMRPMTLDIGVSAATFGFSLALQNIVWGDTAFTLQWLMDDRPPPVGKGTGTAVPAAA